jgi:hypothetical protein
MSDQAVAKQFLDGFDKSNPDSPQNKYGTKGIVQKCKITGVAPKTDGIGFDFDKWEEKNGAKISQPVRYSVTFKYRTGVYRKRDPNRWVDQVTFNGPGVQVYDYPGANPYGVADLVGKEEASR